MSLSKVTIIGGGNMGTAFARAFLNAEVLPSQNLLIVDPNQEKLDTISQSLGCCTALRLSEEQQADSVIILAVKPQAFPKLANQLAPLLSPEQIIVSIMAGLSIEGMQSHLNGHQKIVRAMPNTPAQIGKGMTVYLKCEALKSSETEFLTALFESTGRALELSEERLIDAATAVAGSGPGFIFAIIEAFLDGACELGFSRPEAEELVAQTFTGSLALWEESGESVEALRKKVTSKGGTTQAGLEHLAEQGVHQAIVGALGSAFIRAEELAK